MHGARLSRVTPVESGTTFQVEQAGCASCAELIRETLEELVPVADVAIDEDADLATVRLAPGAAPTVDAVERLLAEAAQGTGHEYRVRPGSWRPVS